MSAFQDRLLALYEERPRFRATRQAHATRSSHLCSRLERPINLAHLVPTGASDSVGHFTCYLRLVRRLLNYATAIGYGLDDEQFARRWPATHIVGKDILRFHAVIWPAMLMAAGVDVPEHVFAHGWLLVGGEKMSKVKLTGIAPNEITDTFGGDAVSVLLHASHLVWPRRLVQLGEPARTLPRRAREWLRQPGKPRARH